MSYAGLSEKLHYAMAALGQRGTRQLWRWIGLWCLLYWLAPAYASWEEQQRAGEDAASQGRRSEARRRFLAAVREARRSGLEDPRLDISLDNLASLRAESPPRSRKRLRVHRRSGKRQTARWIGKARRGRQRSDVRKTLRPHRPTRQRHAVARGRLRQQRRFARNEALTPTRRQPLRQVSRRRVQLAQLRRQAAPSPRQHTRRVARHTRLVQRHPALLRPRTATPRTLRKRLVRRRPDIRQLRITTPRTLSNRLTRRRPAIRRRTVVQTQQQLRQVSRRGARLERLRRRTALATQRHTRRAARHTRLVQRRPEISRRRPTVHQAIRRRFVSRSAESIRPRVTRRRPQHAVPTVVSRRAKQRQEALQRQRVRRIRSVPRASPAVRRAKLQQFERAVLHKRLRRPPEKRRERRSRRAELGWPPRSIVVRFPTNAGVLLCEVGRAPLRNINTEPSYDVLAHTLLPGVAA